MKKTLILFSALLVLSNYSFSQKKFTVNIYGGYTLPLGDLHGNFPDTLGSAGIDFRKTKTLLTSYGINIGVQGKYVIDSSGSARVTAGANYNTFSGSHDYSGVTTYKNKVNIITLSAGIEYVINPVKKYVPFLGLELAANFFGGDIEGSGDTTVTLTRKSETRYGV
ncbi:MAG TPA: hypothetical protein VGK25_12590, partial [Ignavibacteria bacterium]